MLPEVRFDLVAPLGCADLKPGFEGRCARKPWDYPLTAVIPHLDTLEPLKIAIEVLRYQTARPYIMVIDTGSPPEVCFELEKLREIDLEVHFIAAHGWRNPSEVVTAAMDLAQTLCRTELLFHTHSDCFLRRRDFLESVAAVTTANTPVVGYRLSPRPWATEDWEWMVGHTATMCYMPSIHRIGATWSFQRIHYGFGYEWQIKPGWPDTETGFNHCLRDHGIRPVFIGHDRNGERQVDDNIDHVRSYPCSKLYSEKYHSGAAKWMEAAIADARERMARWAKGEPDTTPASYPNACSAVDKPSA